VEILKSNNSAAPYGSEDVPHLFAFKVLNLSGRPFGSKGHYERLESCHLGSSTPRTSHMFAVRHCRYKSRWLLRPLFRFCRPVYNQLAYSRISRQWQVSNSSLSLQSYLWY